MLELVIKSEGWPDRTATLDTDEATLGSSLDCDVVLIGAAVAPLHATLKRSPNGFVAVPGDGCALIVQRAGRSRMAAVENEEPLTPGAVLKMGELDVVVTAMDAPESATGKERHFDATLLAVKCLFAMIIGFGFILPPAALNDLGGAAAASDILDAGGSDLVLAAVSAAPMDWGQEDLVQLSTLETARGEVVYAIDMSGDMDHAGAQKFVGDDQRLVLVDFDEIVAALMTITRYLDVEVTEVTLDDGAFVVSANMPVEKEKRVQEQVTKEMPMLPPLVFENDHLNILREAVDAEIVGVWSGGDEYLLTEAGDRVRKYEMITEEVQFIEIVDAALGAIKFQVKGEEVTWKLNL